jgi:hypothetical protein
LVLLLCIQQLLETFAREPRLIFMNQSGSDINRLVIQSASGRFDAGPVRAGGAVVLRWKPDAGELYLIDGNEFSGVELLHYIELARAAHRDVRLGVDEEGWGWIEDNYPIRVRGYPGKRLITPVYPATGASY